MQSRSKKSSIVTHDFVEAERQARRAALLPYAAGTQVVIGQEALTVFGVDRHEGALLVGRGENGAFRVDPRDIDGLFG